MSARIDKVLEALEQGKVTREEADYYLRKECSTTLAAVEQQAKYKMIAFAVILLAVFGITSFFSSTNFGNVVLDIPQENVSGTTFPIAQPIVGLNITGVMYGDGTAAVYFDTANGSLLVGSITSETTLPYTTQAGYEPGEEVHIANAPENASYYFDDGNASMPVDIPFNASEGDLLIVTTEETYRLPIIIGTAERVTGFSNLCIDTCSIAESNGTLRIETNGTVLSLSRVDAAVLAPNTAPAQSQPLGPLLIAAPVSLDLNQYFTDADDDALHYSTSSNALADLEVQDNILQITPLQAGSGEFTIYVSDLVELVPISVQLTVVNETNETSTANETSTNETADTPQTPATNSTNATTTLDCSSSNPNMLPEECLLINASEYFPEQDIFWESPDRLRVARFTIIGNLLLTGDIIEHSSGTPGGREFNLGYLDRDLNSISTIWIDNEGNLHLKGTLREENANLNPPAGAYSVVTRRGIFLAYADLERGDLYLRGNAIPYRRSIE